MPAVDHHRLAARLTALAMLIGVMANGASPYLKRTGLIEKDAYHAYWTSHCMLVHGLPAGVEAEPGCAAPLIEETDPEVEEKAQRYIFDTSWPESALKLIKDVVGLALIAFSMFLIAKGAAALPEIRHAWPVFLLLVYATGAFLASVLFNGTMVAAVGLRAFMFAMIAVVVQWLLPHLSVIARCVAAVLLLQALLMPHELLRGLHDRGEWFHLARRAGGTLVLPNSLGIFAIAGAAFVYAFAPAQAWFRWLGVTALVTVFLSGSGTGAIAAVLLLFLIINDLMGNNRRTPVAVVGVAVAAAVFLSLPAILSRDDIFRSLVGERGRVQGFSSVFADRSPLEMLFGGGLGTSKMVALQVQSQNADTLASAEWIAARFTDSTVTGLAVEIGLVGAALFYVALGWAARRDRRARPFYYVVALCSLTTNVTLLFPVNFLLGIAWAHSSFRNPHSVEVSARA